uniref:Uncharacterized protein n=2 Tax=Rubinisphaera brasiliensis TaxID=119 RepID=F0SLM9_RUBBR|nr:hypothetical protein Plabr_0082 [Rubinisphaera brasiliensis DSM 5305]
MGGIHFMKLAVCEPILRENSLIIAKRVFIVGAIGEKFVTSCVREKVRDVFASELNTSCAGLLEQFRKFSPVDTSTQLMRLRA